MGEIHCLIKEGETWSTFNCCCSMPEAAVTTKIRHAAEGSWNSTMMQKTHQDMLQRSNRE